MSTYRSERRQLQAAATRQDIVRAALCEELARGADDVLPGRRCLKLSPL